MEGAPPDKARAIAAWVTILFVVRWVVSLILSRWCLHPPLLREASLFSMKMIVWIVPAMPSLLGNRVARQARGPEHVVMSGSALTLLTG